MKRWVIDCARLSWMQYYYIIDAYGEVVCSLFTSDANVNTTCCHVYDYLQCANYNYGNCRNIPIVSDITYHMFQN